MASEKTVNYTAEQEAELVARYQAGETTAELAEAFGKGVRSVIAKLSRLGVYKAKERATSGRVTKAQLVTQIAGVWVSVAAPICQLLCLSCFAAATAAARAL